MSIGTNAVAYKQFIEKSIEGFKKSIGLLKSMTGKKMNISLEGKPSSAFEIDREQFNMMSKIEYPSFANTFTVMFRQIL